MSITVEVPADVPVPLERVEARLVELAGQLAGAMCEFLLLVADFDTAEGWRSWGVSSTAHWLSWKCGVGLHAARQQVRVARDLRTQPLIITEFAAGRLSYSKVRAITRIATETNVETLVGWALTNPADVIERVVAGQRRVARGNKDPRAERATRHLSYRWDEDGSLVGSFRLPAEQAAVLLAALEAAKAALPDPEPEAEAAEDAATPPCETHQRLAAAWHDDCQSDHDCTEQADAGARRWCADISAETLQLKRPTKTSADALAYLCELALRGIETTTVTTGPVGGMPGLDPANRWQLVLHATLPSQGGDFEVEIDGVGTLSKATGERLTCDCPYVIQVDDEHGNPLHLGRKARRARGKLARAVHHRDQGHCQGPGCTNKTTVIHHIIHWVNDGETCIEQLISLCEHHHWLVHEGGWTITTLTPGRWLFQRPDGTPVPTTPGAPLRVTPLPHNDAIAPDAADVPWDGNRDIHDAVWWLANFATPTPEDQTEDV